MVAGSTDPLYGNPFACQQLATFGIVSRGKNPARALGAASMTANTVLAMGGKWFFDETNPTQLVPANAPGIEFIPTCSNWARSAMSR